MDGNYQKFVISKIIEEKPGIRTLQLESDRPVSYRAGQFLTLVFPEAGGALRRSYSFSSSPDTGEPLAITVKRIANGRFSRPLVDRSRVGDTLYGAGVSGQFVLPADLSPYRQLFFFAAGIGITPVYSLIKTILAKHPGIEVVLVYSNHAPETTLFYDDLLRLRQEHPERLKLEFLYSTSPDLTRARLSKWLLPAILGEYARGAAEQQLFYTCGPFAYMRMVMLALAEAGYGEDVVRKEIFDTTRPVRSSAPADKAPHQVVLELPDGRYSLVVQYPDTILRAARREGINLPYSCEAGRCSSCIMRCVSGRVWMSYNEVLTDRELREGKVLTCVGYPLTDDVVLAPDSGN